MKRNSKKFLSLFLSVPVALSVVASPVYATAPDSAVENPAVVEESADAANSVEEQAVQEEQVQPTPETQEQPVSEAEEQTVPEAEEQMPANTDGQTATITVGDSMSAFTIDSSKIELSEIDVNEMQVDENASVDTSDPSIIGIEEELRNIKVLNEDGQSVPLTEEQIQSVLYMFSQYTKQWQENADVLGVQTPFYLQFNDNGEDGLGVLGEMLTLAGVTVEDVRSGNYSYDDLCGMIMNFLYGDQLGIQYYGDIIKQKRDEAIAAVNKSGAKTAVQKLLVLNDWLAQTSTFDMAYLMNQMSSEKGEDPAMAAENPQKHPHYDDIYNTMYNVYEPQIRAQFHDQIYAGVEAQVRIEAYKSAIKSVVTQTGSTEEQADAFIEENKDAIAADPVAFMTEKFGEETASAVSAQVEENLKSEDVTNQIEEITQQQMDQPLEDLQGMSPNQAIPVYTDQAAIGLTEGILGYWEGNQFGALAEGKAVCMGYAKAYAYLVQCISPEYYGVNGAGTDMTVSSNWKKAADLYYDEEGNLDINQDYNVDMVRITFQADVKMYGEPQPEFNSDHFWNAVKVDGVWYYIDPCYTDVWSEVMNRDRAETDGYMNHTYFMISHTSTAEMFDGNYKEIKTLYSEAATDQQYEDAWVARISGNTYSDGTYFYYLYDSTDLLDQMRDFNNDQGNMEELASEEAVYKLVRHKITDKDLGDGDSDYETLIEFNYKESEDDETSVVRVLNPSTGAMEENEELTELYAQFEQDQTVYPAIHITPVYYNNKIYFNISNVIMSYDPASGEVAKEKEYNTVYGVRDDTVVFGAMAFSVTDNAEGADFAFEDHPLAGISLKEDGQLYVSVATNLGFISGKDPHNYTDPSSYGWEFEESNYNPDYNEYMNDKMGDYGDIMEQMGYEKEINDNSEFMWVANFVDKLDMAHFAGDSHTYESVSVDASCEHNSFTENRCTTCGAIEADSRVENENTECDHHYVKFDEEYYTKDDNESWNTGTSYVCTMCGDSVSEPTKPKENSYESDEEYQERLEQYEKDKAIYDAVVASAGHTYEPVDAAWSEDSMSVTFSALQCSSVCPERKNTLDCLINDDTVSVTLSEKVTGQAKLASSEGTCAEGVTSVYTVEGEAEGYKYTATNTVEWPAGDHNFVNGACTKCGEKDPSYMTVPVIESVYSVKQTTAKVTWGIVENADGYQLYRAETPDAPEADWVLTKTINSSNMEQYTKEDTIQYTNVDLTVGKTYYYKVRAFVTSGEGDEADTVYSDFSEVKYMPATVIFGDVYSAATDKVRFNWSQVKGANGYQIWCKDDDGNYKIVKTLGDKGNELTDDQGATTAYSKYELEAGKAYTFKMRAFMIPGDGTKVFGAFSDEIEISVMPEATKVEVYSAKPGRVNLSWDKVNGADGYQIWMATEDSEKAYAIAKVIDEGSTTSYTKSDLKSGTTYYFKVRAYTDDNGKKTYGDYSKVVSVEVK